MWERHNAKLWQYYDMQVFADQVGTTEQWLANKERALAVDDVGDGLEAVDRLVKRHDTFLTALKAQSDKVSLAERS